MAHFLRALILFFVLLHNQAYAIGEPGIIDLDGWSKGTDGTYTQKAGASTVTLTSAPKGITTTSTALVPTSKGTFEFPISKTANVDTARLGGKVASFAKRVGPLGMALTAADLVCSLSNICNQSGNFMYVQQGSFSGTYPSCEAAVGWTSTPTYGSCQDIRTLNPNKTLHWWRAPGEAPTDGGCTLVGTTGYAYAARGYTCTNAPTTSRTVTDADWTTAATKLNDDRFTPHLIDDGLEALPISGIPTLPAGQSKNVGQQSQPVRDSAGNVIGRDDSVTTIEAVDAATAEAPGRVIVKETTTTTRYDTNNTVINTTTATNYTAQPVESKPTNYEIKYDQVAPAELSTYQIPNTFNNTSWGSGTCPADITVVTSIKTFAIPSQPICNAADMLKPFVLLLSTITGIFIISGVRASETA
jgi:hypothetical protein